MHKIRSAAFVAALVVVAGGAFGQQDIFWNNPGDGLWSDALNWTPAVVPNNQGNNIFNATLDLQDQPYSVTADIDVTLQNFSLLWGGATLNLASNSFTVNGDMTVASGTLTRSGGSGITVVSGGLTFLGAHVISAGIIESNGDLDLDGKDDTEIIDTGVHHGGTAINWNGPGDLIISSEGELINGETSTFTINNAANRMLTGDGTGRVENRGKLVAGASDRGIVGVTEFFEIEFVNTGSVEVVGGGLALLTTNDLTDKGTLRDGDWLVTNGAFLDFADSQVSKLDTKLTIEGANSAVFGISGLNEVLDEGDFTIDLGQNFEAQTQFTNRGRIEVGARSTFDAAEFGMGNFDGPGLYFGTFDVTGTFLTGQDLITYLSADLTLRTEGSEFTGIQGLEEIASDGRFAILEGRNFETAGDLIVNDGAKVRVGLGSTLNVNGNLSNNDANGLFDAAAFEIQGTLSGRNLHIVEISNELILDGLDSRIINTVTGEDAIQDLYRIREDGILRLRNGRSLTNLDNLVVDGILSIEGGPNPGRGITGLVQVNGNTKFTRTSMLEIVINGSDEGLAGLLRSDTVDIEEGAILALVVNPGAALAFGDEFSIVEAGLMSGRFGDVTGLDIGNGLSFEVLQSDTGIILRVVPAPAAFALLGFGAVAAGRRRR